MSSVEKVVRNSLIQTLRLLLSHLKLIKLKARQFDYLSKIAKLFWHKKQARTQVQCFLYNAESLEDAVLERAVLEARYHSNGRRSWKSQDKIRGSEKNGLTASEVRDYVKDKLYPGFFFL